MSGPRASYRRCAAALAVASIVAWAIIALALAVAVGSWK